MVRHLLRIAVVVMFAVQLFPLARQVSAQDVLPEGVPNGSEQATVHRVVDGEKVYVRRESGELDQVLLSGIDVPEEGECFFEESKKYLTDLIPKGSEVYLEQSGPVDRHESLVVRYLWLPGGAESKALLINTKMVRDGYAGYDGSLDSPRYFGNLRKAQTTARENDRGLWGACGGVHVEAPTFTTEELDYMTWLNAETAVIDESFVEFNELGANITDVEINDPVWRAEMDAVFATWKLAYESAEARTPPAAFARLHQLWIDGLWHLGLAADYISTFLVTFDLGRMELASEELLLAESSSLEFLDEYERIFRERGGWPMGTSAWLIPGSA